MVRTVLILLGAFCVLLLAAAAFGWAAGFCFWYAVGTTRRLFGRGYTGGGVWSSAHHAVSARIPPGWQLAGFKTKDDLSDEPDLLKVGFLRKRGAEVLVVGVEIDHDSLYGVMAEEEVWTVVREEFLERPDCTLLDERTVDLFDQPFRRFRLYCEGTKGGFVAENHLAPVAGAGMSVMWMYPATAETAAAAEVPAAIWEFSVDLRLPLRTPPASAAVIAEADALKNAEIPA